MTSGSRRCLCLVRGAVGTINDASSDTNYHRERHISNITQHCSFLKFKASVGQSNFGFIFNAQQNYFNVEYWQMDEGRKDSL